MRRKMGMVLLVTGIAVWVLAGAALAQEFSAEMVQSAQGKNFAGKIYVSKGKVRMETLQSITISRLDKKVVWMLMPQDKMYMEQALDPRQTVGTQEKVAGEVSRKQVGQEVINGINAKKFQVVFDNNGTKETIYQWIADKLAMPIKTAAADNSWSMEFRNIKTGPQDGTLFEIPAGYQKFAMQKPSMKDLMKGLGGR